MRIFVRAHRWERGCKYQSLDHLLPGDFLFLCAGDLLLFFLEMYALCLTQQLIVDGCWQTVACLNPHLGYPPRVSA